MTKIKAYIDTNVYIDVLAGTRPSSPASRTILDAVNKELIEAVLSTQSIIDAAYSVRNQNAKNNFFSLTQWALNYINIDNINTFDILNAIKHDTGDFEDDAQVARALDTFCDVFVTGDKKLRCRYNGKHKNLRFMSPEEFVAKMKGEPTPSQT